MKSMRAIPFLISAAVTTALVLALNRPWGKALPMPLGRFISPQQGFWQNAEAADHDFSADLVFTDLKGKAEVYLDERLVPHVFAENDEDLYFIQGYLHARFRLFQMDLQTKAAEGRISEIAGAVAINHDKEQRRLGMRFAAENALKEMENDPESYAAFSAYTRGVNSYIHSLKESDLPLEYKILDFKPEEWTNLRTALLLKMMAKMLASRTENDLGYTNAKAIFTPEQFNAIYPQVPDSLLPIVPRGTAFAKPGIVPVQPASADSIYFNTKEAVAAVETAPADKNNGSNNWVVAGSRTQSGAPILANDPHLELSLPSIWYEMQLNSPGCNVYGVTLPGSPFVIIGFNDSISWGVTNSQRDVKDYFEIKFRDKSRKEYWYNGEWKPSSIRIEKIAVKGGDTVLDTVAYTVHGPVLFDESYSGAGIENRNLAIRWVAHDPSNDGKTFYLLNRATNYDSYVEALKYMVCPGQNFVFASKSGDIAIWQQGKFPARWKGQGTFIMPGQDSSYNWQGFIPREENPHALNPERGFLESANQRAVDSTYPYYIPGSYITPRGITIERYLSRMTEATPHDMMELQGNYFNTLAEDVRPILLKYVREEELSAPAKKYLAIFRQWDLYADPASKGQTIYQCWWDSLQTAIWKDDLTRSTPMAPWPEGEVTMELLKRDSTALAFIDDINTPEKESLADQVTWSLNRAAVNLEAKEKEDRLEWTKFKNPTIYHLLKESLLAFARPGLPVGGNGDIVNAVTHSHGPSWRMITQMSVFTEAYGVYPGGQSGNPGSRYYDNFIDTWARGDYYMLWVMKRSDAIDKKVKWTIRFSKG